LTVAEPIGYRIGASITPSAGAFAQRDTNADENKRSSRPKSGVPSYMQPT